MTKHRKIKTLLLGTIPIIILYLITTGILIFDHKKKLEDFRISKTDKMKQEMELVTITYQRFSDFLFQNTINQPEISQLLYESYTKPETKNKNRSLLQKQMINLYSDLKKYSFRQLHFHLPDTESFLRMHRPEKFGDILADVRETVRVTNLNKTVSAGFEEGRIFNGYRYVYPLFWTGHHAGSVEISISFNATIQSLTKLFNKKYIFILKKEIVDEKVFSSEQSNYSEFGLNSNYLLDNEISNTNFCTEYKNYFKDNTDKQNIFNKQLNSNENFIHPISEKKLNALFTVVKLNNFSGKHVGYLISIDEGTEYRALKKEIFISLLISSSIIFLIFLLVEYYIWSKIKFEELAMYDKLTNLYNRHMFLEVFKQTLARMKRSEISSVIIMGDIDHFKKINDKYGHNKGDLVLNRFAEIVKDCIRESDIPARWGGEEFIILLPKTTADSGIKIAEKIRKKIEMTDFGIKGQVTCSFGVTEIKKDETDIKSMVERADRKLYLSKNSGRNRVEG